eukprot:g47780.t1
MKQVESGVWIILRADVLHLILIQILNDHAIGKAFVKVPNRRLIKKVKAHGIQEKTLSIYPIHAPHDLKISISDQFRRPSYRKDVIKLDRVQKRLTKVLLGMEGLSYKENLD